MVLSLHFVRHFNAYSDGTSNIFYHFYESAS